MEPSVPGHRVLVPPSSPPAMSLFPDVAPEPLGQRRNQSLSDEISARATTTVAPVTSAPPRLFRSTDPSISWVKNHPYWDCDAPLGHGAFGSVRKVKLLTPLGYTVHWEADSGKPKFNSDEDMLLREMTEEEWPQFVGGDDATLQSLKARVSASVQWCQQLNFSGLFCASKTIGATSKEMFQRAREEIKLLNKLADSKHVVRMYDSEAIWRGEFGKVVIVMELGEMDFGDYLKSRSLSDENDEEAQDVPGSGDVFAKAGDTQETPQEGERGPMDAVEIFAWWQQMVAGVQAVHSHDIMHCDIKPSNFIMVRTTRTSGTSSASSVRCEHHKYTLKLCDFGVSRQLEDSETHLSVVNAFGTLLYMSPEVLHTIEPHCKLHITKAGDIWGLGVILHQMLHSGSTPYGHLA